MMYENDGMYQHAYSEKLVKKFEKYKYVENSFSYDFFQKYSRFFEGENIEDSIEFVADICLQSDLDFEAGKTSVFIDENSQIRHNDKKGSFLELFKNYYIKYNTINDDKIIEIIKKIRNANKNNLWNKCKSSNGKYEDCNKSKSIFSRVSSIFTSRQSRRSNSKRGGNRKNNRKSKKYGRK